MGSIMNPSIEAANMLRQEHVQTEYPYFYVAGNTAKSINLKVTITDTNPTSPTYNLELSTDLEYDLLDSDLEKDISINKYMFEGDSIPISQLIGESGLVHSYPDSAGCLMVNSVDVDDADGKVFGEGRSLDESDARVFHVTFVFVGET